MITFLAITAAVLALALWLTTMALWRQAEQGQEVKTIKQQDVIGQWNKAKRLARRSWYGGLRYSKQATHWGNTKVRKAFIAIFPRSQAAFIHPDPLTGLQHGPSSYFLASISKPSKKAKTKKKEVLKNLSEE